MSSFTSPLIVEVIGRKGKLFLPFSYHIGSRYSNNVISVSKGFVSDFASSPSFIWSLIPPWGNYGKAAVLHDYIYQTHIKTRKEADDIFYEAMLVGGTPEWKAKIMYWGVRCWGWLAWRRRI